MTLEWFEPAELESPQPRECNTLTRQSSASPSLQLISEEIPNRDWTYDDGENSAESNKMTVIDDNTKRFRLTKIKARNSGPFKKPKDFACHICKRTFSDPQSKGGHMSKQHKGQSESFRKKTEIRNRNEARREHLAQAKELVRTYTKAEPSAFRGQVTSISKLLKAQAETQDQSDLEVYRVKQE